MLDFYPYDIKISTSATTSTATDWRSVYDTYDIDSIIQKYCKRDAEIINAIKREPEIKKVELTEVVIDLGI